MTPEGWRRSTYGCALVELATRAGASADLPVLSVTKHRGPMLASERFGKVMHGRDLANYRVAPRNTIVADPMLLWDGTIGLQTVADAGLVSPDYRVYQPAEDAAPEYLGYVVRSPHMRRFYEGGARGTNVRRNRIARSDFLAIPLDLPPLAEQRKIAAILSSVDDAIESTQAVLDQLDVVKKAMMAELLTRGIRGRHTKFKMTEIGEVPEEWEVLPLSALAVIQTGIAKGKVPEDGRHLPYLRVANVQDGYVDLGELKTVLVDSARVERYRLRSGDVLFTEGGDADKLGRGCVWRGQVDPCLHQNHVFAVRCVDGALLPEFLAAWSASDGGKAYFLSCAKQTTNLASINSTQLKALPVPLPSVEEQREIVQAVDAVGTRVSAEREILAALGGVKATLSTALLTGELRVCGNEER